MPRGAPVSPQLAPVGRAPGQDAPFEQQPGPDDTAPDDPAASFDEAADLLTAGAAEPISPDAEALLDDLPPLEDLPDPDGPLPEGALPGGVAPDGGVPPAEAALELVAPEDDLPPETLPPEPELIAEPLAPLAEFETAEPVAIDLERPELPRARIRLTLDGLDEAPGLEGPFRQLSELWRTRNRQATLFDVRTRAERDEALVGRLFESEGYYAGQVSTEVTPGAEEIVVTLTADPGRRYRWSEITLDLFPEDRPDLYAEFLLVPGQPIRAVEVEAAEAAWIVTLQREGYPFVELGARDIVLEDAAATGSYLLTGYLGPIASFGRIRLTGARPFDERHAERIARFDAGEPWRGDLVDDFRAALFQTQLLSGIALTPVDTGERTADGRAIVDLEVAGGDAPPRTLAGQLGYSTTEGFLVEGRWRHRNLFPPEGALTGRLVLGTIEQAAGVEFRRSNFWRRDHFLLANAVVSNQTRDAFDARLIALTAFFGRESTPIWQKRWTWSVGVEAIVTEERERALLPDGEVDEDVPIPPRDRYAIAALPGTLNYDGSNDLLDPTRGFRAGIRLSPEAALQGSDANFYLRSQFDGSAYWQATDPLVLAGRVRLASIAGVERADLAPTRRLYAGGGGSVRGYNFQGIGPRGGPNNRPLGGRGLAEASVEARYRFGNFGVVGFVDVGQLSEGVAPRFDDLRWGAGVGGRLYTGFGPLRLDVARAINRRANDPVVAVYISIGQAF